MSTRSSSSIGCGLVALFLLGLFIASFPGAIVLVLLGLLFFPGLLHTDKKNQAMPDNILKAITVLSYAVMKADDSMKRSELYLFKNFMLQNFGPDIASKAIEYLQQTMEYQQQNNQTQINIAAACKELNKELNYTEKMQILRFLFQLGAADGMLNQEEVDKIYVISQWLNIRQQDFYSLRIRFEYFQRTHEQYQQSNNYQNNNQSYGENPYIDNKLEQAYAVLGLKSTDSDETIKKTYRRLALANHPDKVQHLGETARQEAEKRFSEISQAYNIIKKARNL
ncbi:MAG: TerB family tellurite resistance protein [Bacteroidales bacterium]|nr:TerB family tellurite resistance protein [Bacteroidales bacterium]